MFINVRLFSVVATTRARAPHVARAPSAPPPRAGAAAQHAADAAAAVAADVGGWKWCGGAREQR